MCSITFTGRWLTDEAHRKHQADRTTLDQRLALLRHALYSLASAAPHGDPVAASVEWDREKALAVIAVSALAACHELRMPPASAP